MNLKEDILIEKFLRKKLSKEEYLLFTTKMETDIMFKEKVEFEKQLFQTLNQEEWSYVENKNSEEVKAYMELFNTDTISELKTTLQKENKIYQNKTKSKTKTWFLYIAAAVVILFLSMYNFVDLTTSNQDLYANYISKTELNSIVSRSDVQNELTRAEALFEAKDYEIALFIFEKEVKKTTEPSSSLLVYTGIAQMELNQFDKAMTTFNNLITSDLLDANNGLWFKALLYLKMDERAKAKEVLLIIALDKSNYKYKEAKEIINNLE